MLEAGVRIFEYEPGMTHVKALLVDDLWSVIGTTNLDNRSFEHNDEVNLAVRDQAVTARILADFDSDQARSREITLAAGVIARCGRSCSAPSPGFSNDSSNPFHKSRGSSLKPHAASVET
jgi:phosphatidylserine/phosphatidylglycerophosphate/cardiolipin synthase-like enzyme